MFAHYTYLDAERRAGRSRRPRAQPQGRHRPSAAARARVHHGLSGSGKSSLAFDTIYAEGQRRYVEALSAYARQFLQMMEKPDVDSIDGLSPAISIDQKTTSRNPRSTVGTVTEIYDYLRLLYARVGRPHCPVCGRPIAGQSLEQIVDQVLRLAGGDDASPSTRRSCATARASTRTCSRSCARRLHAREGRRRAAAARGADRARQEVQAHDRGRRRPARDEARPAARGSRSRSRRRPRSPTGWSRSTSSDGEPLTLQRELRVPRARRLAAGAPAAHLLLQLAARRLPALHRARRAAGDRPGPARPRPVAVDRRGRARAVVGRQLELLRVGDPGDRRPLRDRPRHALAGAAGRAAEPVPVRHERRTRLRPVPQPDGPQALVHARVRGHRPEPASAATRRPTRRSSASGSRST